MDTVFQRVSGLLDAKSISYEVLRHAPVFTSEEAAAIRGTPLASGAKALICKADEKFLMVVLPADRKLASKLVRKAAGAKSLRFASREEVDQLTGLAPGGHGFHIHEKGDCSAPDAMSAGGHFNPTGKPHGAPDVADHHAGDMQMLQADASGNATLTTDLTGLGIGSGPADIVGKAVIVHKDADDYKTQPTGNSGARVACGVINKS